MADKRIYQLGTDTAFPLDWKFPVDNNGNAEAQYRTIQQLINLIQTSVGGLMTVYAGSGNPDNAQGLKGDLYFKSNGLLLSLYQKGVSTWGSPLFTIAVPPSPIIKPHTDLLDYGGGNYYMPFVMPSGAVAVGARQDFTDGVTPTQFFNGSNVNGDAIEGITSNAPSTITITLSS